MLCVGVIPNMNKICKFYLEIDTTAVNKAINMEMCKGFKLPYYQFLDNLALKLG